MPSHGSKLPPQTARALAWSGSAEGRATKALFWALTRTAIVSDDRARGVRFEYVETFGTSPKALCRGDSQCSQSYYPAPAPPWRILARARSGAWVYIRWSEWLSLHRAARDMALRDFDRDAAAISKPRILELSASAHGGCCMTAALTTRPRLSLAKRDALQRLAEARRGQRRTATGPVADRTRRRWERAARLQRPAPTPDRFPEELFRLLGMHGTTATDFDVAGIEIRRANLR